MRKLLFCVSIILLCISTVITADEIHTEIIQRNIIYDARLVDTQYPLLSYNDTTYIAVRDVGKLISRKVRQEENYNRICFDSFKIQAIKNDETGEAIAKAIVKEFYGDKITENTIYRVGYVSKSLYFDDAFTLAVIFNPEKNLELSKDDNDPDYAVYVLNNSDIIVNVSSFDGKITVEERQEDGRMKELTLVELSQRQE